MGKGLVGNEAEPLHGWRSYQMSLDRRLGVIFLMP